MTLHCFLPRYMAAVAMGADQVAAALTEEAARRGMELALTRTGTRGMFWLEPLLEVATPAGRIAFGPLSPDDVPGVLEAIVTGGEHGKALGAVEAIAPPPLA